MSTNQTNGGPDDVIAQPFDQTNGLADAGESDGTAESDTASAAERGGDDAGLGGGDAVEEDGGQGGMAAGLNIRHQQ
jgi:hypothetical protein